MKSFITFMEKTEQETFPYIFESDYRRASTQEFHYRALKKAIHMMREKYQEPLTLQDIADTAQLSPYHFNRIFRTMTGIPPSVFLSALRIEAAKKLLLTTNRSVTDICFDVGYRSLGTFTHRFTQFVGTSPTRLRSLAQTKIMYACLEDIQELIEYLPSFQGKMNNASITGLVNITIPFSGVIFIGIFRDPLPQGQPLGCALLTAPGHYSLPPIPDGHYYLFATALAWSENFLTALTTGTGLRGKMSHHAIDICQGTTKEETRITLHPDSWIDPPILIALPWLIITHLAHWKLQCSMYS